MRAFVVITPIIYQQIHKNRNDQFTSLTNLHHSISIETQTNERKKKEKKREKISVSLKKLIVRNSFASHARLNVLEWSVCNGITKLHFTVQVTCNVLNDSIDGCAITNSNTTHSFNSTLTLQPNDKCVYYALHNKIPTISVQHAFYL